MVIEESTMHLISGAPVNFWREQSVPTVSSCDRKNLLCILSWCKVLEPEVVLITLSVRQARMLEQTGVALSLSSFCLASHI